MGRTAAEIYNQDVAYYVVSATAAGLVDPGTGVPLVDPAQWSMADLQQLFLDTAANSEAIFEQVLDDYLAQLKAIAASAPPQTALWIQNFVLNTFQYNDLNPQILQFDKKNFVPAYLNADGTPNVNAAYNIVKQCVIVPGAFGNTYVRVAQAGPIALTTQQLASLQSALNLVTIPGFNINNVTATTGNSDKIYINGILTYVGQYASIIQSAVTSAIQAFLSSIPTIGIVTSNSPVGIMRLTALISAVKAVPGVVDFELTGVNARADSNAFTPGSYNLVQGADWLLTQWNSGVSGNGYMTTETAAGYTINDSLTYQPQ